MSEKAAIRRLALGGCALLLLQLGTIVMVVQHQKPTAATVEVQSHHGRRLQQVRPGSRHAYRLPGHANKARAGRIGLACSGCSAGVFPCASCMMPV